MHDTVQPSQLFSSKTFSSPQRETLCTLPPPVLVNKVTVVYSHYCLIHHYMNVSHPTFEAHLYSFQFFCM